MNVSEALALQTSGYVTEKERASVVAGLLSAKKFVLSVTRDGWSCLVNEFNDKVRRFYEYDHYMWLKSNHPMMIDDLRNFYGLDEELDENEYELQYAAFWRQITGCNNVNGDPFELYISS